jgi:hypothetical protein
VKLSIGELSVMDQFIQIHSEQRLLRHVH